MPAKKLNLSAKVKNRLRQTVLGGITPISPGSKAKTADNPQVKSKMADAAEPKPKPAAKILRKIVISPKKSETAEKAPLPKPQSKPQPKLLLKPLPKLLPKPQSKLQPKPMSVKPNPINQISKNMIETKSKAAVTPSIPSAMAKADMNAPTKAVPPKSAAKRAKKKAPKKTKAAKAGKIKPEKKRTAPKPPAKSFAIAKTEKLTPPFSVPPQKIKPAGYQPFATVNRDWEKPQKKEESLESLFKGAEKRKAPGHAGSFFKSASLPKMRVPGKRIWLKVAGLIVLLAVLLAGYMALGIYKYGFNDAISNQVAKALFLPAGSVNGSAIGAGAYMDDLRLLAQPLAMSREGLIDYSGKSDLSDRIFYRLAVNELVSDKLKSYGKPISQKDLDDQVAMLLKQTGGRPQAEKIINNLYGLSLAQFENLVLVPMMQRANLQAAIVADDSLAITQAAKLRADEILKLAKASTTDFSVLAKQHTDDEAGVNTGGDLGWVVKGQLDQAWESLIFSAATGTVISQPIKSGFGFHIVKVEQRLTDKTTGNESVKLRHILVKVDVDKYIKDLLDSADIVRYIQ